MSRNELEFLTKYLRGKSYRGHRLRKVTLDDVGIITVYATNDHPDNLWTKLAAMLIYDDIIVLARKYLGATSMMLSVKVDDGFELATN
jgi:hypothetical protein